MDAVLLLVAAFSFVGSVGAIGWAAAMVARRTRAEWTCTVAGRAVRVVATQNKKVLFVEGQRVAEKTTLSSSGATLSWERPQDAGPPIVVTVTVAHPPHEAAPQGAIYADGRWVGGSKREEHVGNAFNPVPSPTRTPITDSRWPAAEVLLRDLRAVPRPEVTEAARRIDAHVVELLHALLEVHLLAMEGAVAPLHHVDELVARMAAEAEVDRSLSRAARDGAARAQRG